MVYHGRVELLSHDLSQKYLQMKWNAYGKYIHFSHLILYLCYLGILTSYASGYLRRIETKHSMFHGPNEDLGNGNGGRLRPELPLPIDILGIITNFSSRANNRSGPDHNHSSGNLPPPLQQFINGSLFQVFNFPILYSQLKFRIRSVLNFADSSTSKF